MALEPSPTALRAAALAVALAAAAPLAAAEHPLEATVLVAPERDSESYQEVVLDRFWGVGLAWNFSEAWAVEARGQFQDGRADYLAVAVDGYDLGARRAFALADRWRPYVAGGAHFRDTEIEETVACLEIGAPCPPLRRADQGRGAFLGAGIDWNVLGRLALRFDGRYRAYDSSRFDRTETEGTVAVGLALRF